jgi:hypothetical protein
VTSIGDGAFRSCDSLTAIDVDSTNPNYASISGVLFNKALTTLMQCPDAKAGAVSIPASVTTIEDAALSSCYLLTAIDVASSNPSFASSDGILFNKTMTTLIQCPGGKAGAVTIPDGVLTIAGYAFYYCDSIYSVTIPGSVTSIGEYAFYSCELLDLRSGLSGVVSISDYAFYNCNSLTSAGLGSSLSTIGDYAFYSCDSLTSVNIPANVSAIGDRAFSSCNSLAAIEVASSNMEYTSVDGVLLDEARTTVIQCPVAKTGAFAIPASVTTVSDYAFNYCTLLTSVTVPDGIETIGKHAFYSCDHLTIVNVPASVRSIGTSALSDCDSLTAINIDVANPNYASVDGMLFDKALTTLIQCPAGKSGNLTLPGTVTVIDDNALYFCDSVISVDMPDGVTTIGDSAFYYCTSLTSVSIPMNLTSIGDYTFYYCSSLTSVTMPDSISTIGEYAFYSCDSLTELTLPDGVAIIGEYAFSSCDSLASLNLSDNVSSLGKFAFSYCDSLTSVRIPGNVTSIGERAFYVCDSLTAIDVDASNPNYASVDGMLFDKALTTLIQCPGGKSGNLTIPGTVTVIDDYAFYSCGSMTSVTILGNIASIGDSAFYNCYSLTKMDIPSTVSHIGDSAFLSCNSLTAIDIDAANLNYASIDGVLFDKALTTLIQCPGGKAGDFTVPNGAVSIGEDAFYNCDRLTTVTVSDSVIHIGDNAFCSCDHLSSISLGSGTAIIGPEAFSYCDSLTSVRIPGNVTSIGERAFHSCDSLTAIGVDAANPSYASIDGVLFDKALTTLIQCPGGKAGNLTIPGSVNLIDEYAFSDCDELAAIYVGSGVSAIGDNAFSDCDSLASIVFLGLVAPFNVGEDWIDDTDSELRGHAYAASDFPAPGGSFHGLTMGATISLPSPPRNLTAAGGDAHVTLTWLAPADRGASNVTSYNIYRSTAIDGNYSLIASINALSYTDTGLSNNQTYYYKVSAVSAAGEGFLSDAVHATPEVTGGGGDLMPILAGAGAIGAASLAAAYLVIRSRRKGSGPPKP